MSKKRKNSNYITSNPKIETVKKRPKINPIPYIAAAVAVIILVAAVVLIVTTPWLYATPKVGKNGASDYLYARNTDGRDIKYVKMDIQGYGSMVILLDATTAPITVANFIKLVNEGFYDGLSFHRVIEGFMIQGGCPEGDGTGSSDEKIKGEFSENGYDNDMPHIKGVISMARSNAYNSASCQFFICNDTGDNVTLSLDGKYAAFGYVVAGLDIVDEITADSLPYTGDNGAIEMASKQVVIKKVTVLDDYG